MRQLERLLLLLLPLLLCVFSWRVFPIHAKLQTDGSFFTTDGKPSAFWSSQNGQCTFGFKRVPSPFSDAYLLSLWFTNDPEQTPIWWPSISPDNLETPVVQKGALLRFTREASLELWALNAEGLYSVVWSEVESMGKCGSVEVTDSCNLVVYDMQSKVQLWQSYADARDSLMLPSYGNGSLEDRARVIQKPYLLQSRRNDTSFAPGQYRVSSDYKQNLVFYAALDQLHNDNSEYIYMAAQMEVRRDFQIVDANGKLAFLNNGTMPRINRLTLSSDGNLILYSWGSNSWRKIWQLVDDLCKLASPCGPFAICKVDTNNKVQCKCPFITENAKLSKKASRKVTIRSAAEVPWQKSAIRDSEKTCGSNMGLETSGCGKQHGTIKRNYTMFQAADSDYYYSDLKPPICDISLEQCKDLCLQDCECIAVSHKASASGLQCMLKGNRDVGLLMNGYESSGTTLLIKMQMTSTDTSKGLSKSFVGKATGLTSSIGLVVLSAIVGCMWLVYKHRMFVQKSAYEDSELNIARENGGPKRFTYKEIRQATDRFSNWVGEGGFGKVYKGWITAEKDWAVDGAEAGSGCHTHLQHKIQEQAEQKKDLEEGSLTPSQLVPVAIKVLKGSSSDDFDQSEDQSFSNQKHADGGEKQFKAEVSTLGKIHHVNLVSLLGYCAARRPGRHQTGKRILVYEYMENGSLEKYLTMPSILQEDYIPWQVRHSIALDTARGIAYLHHDCNPPIIHCDIKPQNVLLDKNFHAKVADFGLAYTLKNQQSHLSVTAVHGTRGYLAPEWLHSGEVTAKVDVYSYGMLLLELVYAGEPVENAVGVIVNRSTLLHWAMQSLSKAAARASDTDNNRGLPPPQSVCTAASKALIVDKSLEDFGDCTDDSISLIAEECVGRLAAPNGMIGSITAPVPLDSDDTKQYEVCEDGIMCAPPADESEEKLRLIKIGLWCVQYTPTLRPSMSTVVQLLQGTTAVVDPPHPHPRLHINVSLTSPDVSLLAVKDNPHPTKPDEADVRLPFIENVRFL
ncbi:hypothetical protein L7F22_059245 [Adiantum nelumboides]|nr:hypothetical protein [Adiantum nelumboides]